jgi:hypothetical protein
MVAYFLPLEGGAHKNWGTPTDDFWCCHGSLVQAHTRHSSLIYYETGDDTIVVGQHIPSRYVTTIAGEPVRIVTELRDTVLRAGPDANASAAGSRHRPESRGVVITVSSGASLTLRVRIPSWSAGPAHIRFGDEERLADAGFVDLALKAGEVRIELTIPTELRTIPIPDEPETVAFASGPVVLAGLVDRELALVAPASGDATQLLAPDNERQWGEWLPGYRTVGQPYAIRFTPLYEVTDEAFSVYFPVRSQGSVASGPLSSSFPELVEG